MKLILVEFTYNNSYYLITKTTPFYICYSFYLFVKIYIKDNITKEKILATKKRVEIIKKEKQIFKLK